VRNTTPQTRFFKVKKEKKVIEDKTSGVFWFDT